MQPTETHLKKWRVLKRKMKIKEAKDITENMYAYHGRHWKVLEKNINFLTNTLDLLSGTVYNTAKIRVMYCKQN